MGTTRLSLCMIVKDEEDCIARCLDSVKDIVDEILIVDTGSTDRTLEICKSFGAKIEKFKWNGSFADARNYGIQKATGDWIIWLDADEELDIAAQNGFFEGSHFEDYDIINLHLINYYGDQVDVNNTTDIAHTRLFRNNGIQFVNKMHECLDLKNVSNARIGHLDVKVHHYGYLNSITKKKGKSDRNLKMLKRQIKDGENVYWAHYFIGLEYYNMNKYQEALEHVNLSILAFLREKVLPPSMVYKLKYSILIATGHFEMALEGIKKAILLYPDYVDLRFFRGVILYHLEDYESSIKSFKECLELGEDNRNYLILRGVGSFQAWYYISLCQNDLQQKEEAIVSVMKCLLIAPLYKEALKLLTIYMNDKGISVDECLDKHFNEENLKVLKDIIEKIGR
ncbi:glycosyltransferase [Neobacillus sp. D3-1R]|uniref:glycosyltransferase n=1 Tax=Neobacillus sp. D3-1R TaxID=3445778 RepID=UPI003FA1894E